MKNSNILPFYIGQTVEYITGKNMPKGTKGKVLDIQPNCCNCCSWVILFSSQDPKPSLVDENRYSKVHCRDCNTITTASEWNKLDKYWKANSFKPIQESLFPSLTYKKVVEKESKLISLN